MKMNALNGDWSDIDILPIIIQYKLEKVSKILQENFARGIPRQN